MKKNNNHICKESDTCTCETWMSEPDEKCPKHGVGEYPPRCCACGKYMRRGIPYSISEARLVAKDPSHLPDQYHRELFTWLCNEADNLTVKVNELRKLKH